MSIPYDTDNHIDSLCKNMKEWLTTKIADIEYDEVEPQIWYSQSHGETEFPAIFIYPKTVSETPPDAYAFAVNTLTIGVDLFLRDVSIEDLTQKVAEWTGRVKNAVFGRITGQVNHWQEASGGSPYLFDHSIPDIQLLELQPELSQMQEFTGQWWAGARITFRGVKII